MSVESTRLPIGIIIALFVALTILYFFGPNIPNSGVVQLETALLQVNGFLLAFVSVAFTGMVAEVRSRSDIEIIERRKLSKGIRRASLQSFASLMFGLVVSVAILTNALVNPSGQMGVYLAEFFPLAFTLMGLAYLLIALFLFSKME